MPTIDEELVQNAKAHFASKTDFSDKATFGSDVEVDGKLQVNTATDIVTKDGTSIGGGEIPTLTPVKFDEENLIAYFNFDEVDNAKKGFYYNFPDLGNDKVIYIQLFGSVYCPAEGYLLLAILGQSKLEDNTIPLYITEIEYATKSDLPNVWAQYRHTVTIKGTTDSANGTQPFNFAFTTLSSKNTIIDSIQDLTSLFGNTEIGGFGWFTDLGGIFNKIKVGTSITDTAFIGMIGATDTQYQASKLTSITITDNVTQD